MAFPIIPKRRSGASGNPTTLQLGELAVNTLNGELYLGADAGVTLLNGPVAAGTTVTEHTGDGTTTAFTFAGYNGTADGGYIVSVGGIDQPPSKYSISATAGGTITFVEAPITGELISIRAIVAGSGGGGGDGNAIQIQGRDVASTAPTAGQVLAWSSANNRWQPTSLNGSVTFNTAGSHQWAVPAWVRWVYVNAAAGDGTNGTATNGAPGEVGQNATETSPATTGANGANGTASAGVAGASIEIYDIGFNLTGGAAGLPGIPGYGGGGSGGGGSFEYPAAASGATGNGPFPGGGGSSTSSGGFGGAAGGEGATAGGNGGSFGAPGAGGSGATDGGAGGGGGTSGSPSIGPGGGGGGVNRSGGGGGAGGDAGFGLGFAGQPGAGGIADTSMCAGGLGETYSGPLNLTAIAGTTTYINIIEGAGTPSITITW